MNIKLFLGAALLTVASAQGMDEIDSVVWTAAADPIFFPITLMDNDPLCDVDKSSNEGIEEIN